MNQLLTASKHNGQALLKECQLQPICALAHDDMNIAGNKPS